MTLSSAAARLRQLAASVGRELVRKRKLSRKRARRGVAFVLVLGALTILTVMLTEVQDESSAELASALEARDAVIGEYAAKSAINLSRLLIASEPTIRKSIGIFLGAFFGGNQPQIPVWQFSDQLLGAFNDPTGVASFASFAGLDPTKGRNLGMSGASFEITIVDEDAKLNINAAFANRFAQQRLMQQLMARMMGPQYNPLFEQRDPDGNFSDRQAICAALIDYADSDQETTLCDPTNTTAQEMPAEDSYYELLPKPYHRKNAAFDSLQEIRRVRGIGDDFWSTFVDPDPDHPEKRLWTVWGQSGAININTAAPQTLIMLVCANAAEPLPKLCTDPMEMQKLLTILTLARGFMAGVPPFGSPDAFINALQANRGNTTPGATPGAAPSAAGGLMGALGGGAGMNPFSMMLQAMGVEPIVFKSAAEAKAQMSTESKVFSIYATGVVKAGKRETRTHIHAVLDYRAAPPPGMPLAGYGLVPPGSPSAAATAPFGTPPPAATLNPSGTGTAANPTEGIQGALRPNPGGNVIYYRMD